MSKSSTELGQGDKESSPLWSSSDGCKLRVDTAMEKNRLHLSLHIKEGNLQNMKTTVH